MDQKPKFRNFHDQTSSEDTDYKLQDGEAELRKWKILSDLPQFLLREIKYAAVARRLETNFQGWYGYALLVTNDDSVYVIGDNRCGQLGLPKHLSHFAGPTRVEALCGLQIVGFATSWNNVACWTRDGKLFMMGHNNEGQLGVGHAEEVVGPKQVMNLMPEVVIKASCGRLHTLCLTESGHVYSWGVLSVYNQLINSDRKNIGVIPLRVVFPIIGTRVVDIGCGAYTSYALTGAGKIYAWGRNKSGQAGVGQDIPIVENPVQVKFPDDELIIEMACGYSHCLALTDRRTLYAWGTNLHGEVGNGTKTVVWEPLQLNLDQVETIATSNALSTSACKTDDGIVWIWGRSAHCLEPKDSLYEDEAHFFAAKDLGLCETMMVRRHGTFSGEGSGATGTSASLPTAKANITVENAIRYYTQAIRTDDSALGLQVANFATRHLSEILDKTDLEKVNSVVLKNFMQDVKAFGAFDLRSKMKH